MGSWVETTAYQVLLFVFRQITGEWSNQLWDWFSRFFAAPVAVLDDPVVRQLTSVFIGIGLGVLPVAIAWTVIGESLKRLDGAGTVPPEALVRRALIAGAAVTGTSTVAWFMQSLAEHARGVLTAVGMQVNVFEVFFKLPIQTSFVMILLTLGFLVGVLAIIVQRWVVAGEFTVLLAVGPLMAAGLLRDGANTTWTVWLREMTALLVTPLIQFLLLVLFARKWGSAAGLLDMGDRIAALAFLYLLWNTPRWARQLVYSVGTAGAVAGTGATMARFMVMQHLARRMLRI